MSALVRQMMQDSPVGLWTLTESDVSVGATIGDSSGNARNGSVVSGGTISSVASTRWGRYMQLGGSASLNVSFGDLVAFESAGAFAAEVWVYADAVAMAPGTPMSKYTPNVGSWTIGVGTDATGAITEASFFWFQQTSFSVWKYAQVTGQPSTRWPRGWHHLMGTLDASNNVVIYVDGVAAATNTSFPGGTRATSDTSLMGLGSYGSGQFDWLGGLSHAAVYASAPAADRVLSHYLAGLRTGVTY